MGLLKKSLKVADEVKSKLKDSTSHLQEEFEKA